MKIRNSKRRSALGLRIYEARVKAGIKVQDLARKARLSMAAVYNCEKGEGRTMTFIVVAMALGLMLLIPDLKAAAARDGLTPAKVAVASGLAFDTVRSAIADPKGGNVRTLEELAAFFGEPLVLV